MKIFRDKSSIKRIKVNKLKTVAEVKAAIAKAAKHGDRDSVYVRHLKRRLEALNE